MAGMTTLIVGGGIGGLSLARELARRGLPATVLEKTPELMPIGAGIIMNPNAMRVLERNGLADEVRRESWPYLLRETCDQHGHTLALRDYRPLYDAEKLSRGALVHRAHLLEVLLRSVPPEAIRFGTVLNDIEILPDRVRIMTDSGETLEADLLVGADGIRSEVRRRLFGDVRPLYMGYRSHRFVVDNTARIDHFMDFLGRGQRIGLVPISKSRLYVWTTFNSPGERPPAFAGIEEFRRCFAQFTDARVKRVFAALASLDEVITTDVEEIRMRRWIGERAALLGDAAHAMTPNIGQGAGMAMEDAAVLAEALAGAPGDLSKALQRYAARRGPRVELVMRVSREVGDDGQRANRLACWARNRRLRRAGRNAEKMQAELERLLVIPE
jgi:2-polyprenyl-6-methoxyphenol hydroxylase-like FAD-dependent oxidoreductase